MSSIAESKGLLAEQVGRDRVPWSTGRYCEKPDPGPPSDRTCAGKSLILRDAREQIPYATEQGNKSDEQGDKIDDQGIKSAEHGKARQVSSGRRWQPVGAPDYDLRRAAFSCQDTRPVSSDPVPEERLHDKEPRPHHGGVKGKVGGPAAGT